MQTNSQHLLSIRLANNYIQRLLSWPIYSACQPGEKTFYSTINITKECLGTLVPLKRKPSQRTYVEDNSQGGEEETESWKS